MEIAIVNQSSMVTNAQVEVMCQACQNQFTHDCAPAWGSLAPTVTFYAAANQVPKGSWIVYIIDNDSQVAGALGYHNEQGDTIQAFIMAQPILSNGGVVMVFDPKNPSQYTVSGTLSHELMEMFGDRYVNTYCQGTNGGLFCAELADPVEQLSYGIEVNGTQIAVSNFVLPTYFDPQGTAKDAPFDFLKQLNAPFTMATGGYMITATISNEGQITAQHQFDESVPPWRRDQVKSDFYRR
jgi:hypothetical protein